MEPNITFSLKEILDEKKITIKQCAEEIGETNSESVRRLASGEASSISFKRLARLCAYFKLHPGKFFKLHGVGLPEEEPTYISLPRAVAHYLDLGLLQKCRFLHSAVNDYSKQSNEVKFVFDREYERLRQAMQYTDDPDLKKSFAELTKIYQSEKEK